MNRLGQTLLNGLLNMTIRHLHLAVTCCFASLLWVTAHGQNTFSGSKSLEDIASDPQNPKPNVLMIVIDDLNDWVSIVRGRRPRLQEQNHVQGLFKLEAGRGEAGFDIVLVMPIPDPIAQKFHRTPVLT